MEIRISILCLIILIAAQAPAQVTVDLIEAPEGQSDPNIVVYNDVVDRPNNKSGWIYDPTSPFDPPYRDLGQSFRVSEAFTLDKIIVEISGYSTQEDLDACAGAPFHLDVYTFPNVDGMTVPDDTVSSQGGRLPAVMKDGEAVYLQFDVENIEIKANRFYGFLLKFDSLKTNRYLEIVKTEDSDFYPDGRMIYTEFNGDDGRQNITVYKLKHAGGNPKRDLHFWLVQPSVTAVSQRRYKRPQTVSLVDNYPNPFNPSTTIEFSLDRGQNVHVDIFTSNGRLIRRLVDEWMSAGTHTCTWMGRSDDGSSIASGVYYYRLRGEEEQVWDKMVYLK